MFLPEKPSSAGRLKCYNGDMSAVVSDVMTGRLR